MRRWLWTATIAALASLALAGCGDDGGDAEDEGAAAEGIAFSDLGPCGTLPKPPGFRCGEIEVPFERDDPDLGEITIGFAVRERDEADSPSKGAIFAVEGGPGYSSTGTAQSFQQVFAPLLRNRELVLVDMRGTGRSEPLDCPDLQRGRAPDWLGTAECAERLGDRFASYRTAAAADDIDGVREALGYDEITLYGDSYGTFLSQSYAYRHPDRLNALVLDSAYPAYGEDPWYPSLVRTGVRSLEKVCDRDPECEPGAGKRLERFVERLRRTRGDVGILLDVLSDATYNVPGDYRRINRAIDEFLEGDITAWQKLTAKGRPGLKQRRSYVRAGEYVFGCNDYPMIWDKEADEPERRRQLEQAIQEYDPDAFPPFTPREVALSSEVGYLECLVWPPPSDLYEPAVDPEEQEPTEAPVLVIQGELDDITTPWEAKVVANRFPNSELIVIRGAGHTSALYYYDGEASTEIRDFLERELNR